MTDPLDSTAILLSLKAELETWLRANLPAGRVIIAADPWNALELLAENPPGFRIILADAGDAPLGDEDQVQLLTIKFDIFLTANLGLTPERGLPLIQAGAERPALTFLRTQIRHHIKSLRFPNDITSVYPRYLGCSVIIAQSGLPLAAFKMTFELDLNDNLPTTTDLIPSPLEA